MSPISIDSNYGHDDCSRLVHLRGPKRVLQYHLLN